MKHVTITKFNVHHLDYNHGFLSIEYSKLPIKKPVNSIFRVNCLVTITKFNVHHLDYNHGFLSIEYSKLPIKKPVNSIFRVNCLV